VDRAGIARLGMKTFPDYLRGRMSGSPCVERWDIWRWTNCAVSVRDACDCSLGFFFHRTLSIIKSLRSISHLQIIGSVCVTYRCEQMYQMTEDQDIYATQIISLKSQCAEVKKPQPPSYIPNPTTHPPYRPILKPAHNSNRPKQPSCSTTQHPIVTIRRASRVQIWCDRPTNVMGRGGWYGPSRLHRISCTIAAS